MRVGCASVRPPSAMPRPPFLLIIFPYSGYTFKHSRARPFSVESHGGMQLVYNKLRRLWRDMGRLAEAEAVLGMWGNPVSTREGPSAVLALKPSFRRPG